MENQGNYFLLPGEKFAERRPFKVETILRPRLAICFKIISELFDGSLFYANTKKKANNILRFGNISII